MGAAVGFFVVQCGGRMTTARPAQGPVAAVIDNNPTGKIVGLF
jgi:hypothetical protein